MSPFFNQRSVKEFYPALQDIAYDQLKSLKPGNVIDLREWTGLVTLRTIVEYAFNCQIPSPEFHLKGLHRGFELMMELTPYYLVPGLSNLPVVKRKNEEFKKPFADLLDVIQTSEGDNVWNRLTTYVGENGESLSKEELIGEFQSLIIAGYETTSSAMIWLLTLLDEYPDVRTKLINEIEDTIGDQKPTLEELNSMKYLGNLKKKNKFFHQSNFFFFKNF